MFTGKCAIRTASLVLLTLSASPTFSEPARTIKIVVPQTPGGSVDFLARVLAEYMGQAQRVTMVVENRPGAGSEIGTEAASRAIPDGNTLLINGGANLLIVPHLRKVGFDPLASFVPICNLANGPNLILVNSASPYRTLAELLDAARARPGELTLATIGPATESQIQFEKLQHAAGVKMTFVPYPGVGPAVSALLGGHVTSVIASYAASVEQVTAGHLRALATTSPARIEGLPDVPTVAQAGSTGYQATDPWTGAFAPAKTPNEAISQLINWFSAALQTADVRKRLGMQGLYPVGICGSDFARQLREQYDDFGRFIREMNMKAD
jgi:tripartite-type tricarboxylate transporter receptor subunit TctC